MLSAPGREINLCFKWDWNPGHFDFLSIALANRWSTCNPLLYTLFYLNLHYSTMALLHFYSTSVSHGSILLYLILLHSTIGLLHSYSLFFILQWLYLTVHHSIYYGTRSLHFIVPWLYLILFYCLHVSRDHRNVAWHWTQLGCAKRFILYVPVLSLLHCALWLLWVLSTA